MQFVYVHKIPCSFPLRLILFFSRLGEDYQTILHTGLDNRVVPKY
ncbi:hypothetical protein GJV44_00771 [Candidatus Vallotia cooleyia]|nr:hypothetical protein GJV44_00771 [Candidatus Vallotia cooleyia]